MAKNEKRARQGDPGPAHRMWLEAGSPKGREDEYIERARELQAIVDHPGAGLLPNPMVAAPVPGRHRGVEEAELLENLGEFPGRSDQGDRHAAPMTKAKARQFRHGDKTGYGRAGAGQFGRSIGSTTRGWSIWSSTALTPGTLSAATTNA